tara:strand:+ start:244 stop:468 length:225 start_codon:yes stop_codon:yes gene_type:complete
LRKTHAAAWVFCCLAKKTSYIFMEKIFTNAALMLRYSNKQSVMANAVLHKFQQISAKCGEYEGKIQLNGRFDMS